MIDLSKGLDSTSYTCCYCGNVREVHSSNQRLIDAGVYICENGHALCLEHIFPSFKGRTKKEAIIEFYENLLKYFENLKEEGFAVFVEWANEKIPAILDKIEEIKKQDEKSLMDAEEFMGWVIKEYVLEDEEAGFTSMLCPICQFRYVTEHDTLEYLLKKCGMSLEDVQRKIKEKYKTYKEFKISIL